MTSDSDYVLINKTYITLKEISLLSNVWPKAK
jgi:hypothetical protein